MLLWIIAGKSKSVKVLAPQGAIFFVRTVTSDAYSHTRPVVVTFTAGLREVVTLGGGVA